jgi:hypothetical protein
LKTSDFSLASGSQKNIEEKIDKANFTLGGDLKISEDFFEDNFSPIKQKPN